MPLRYPPMAGWRDKSASCSDANRPMIELDNVTKFYGNFPAVTDISFRVEEGEVLGFLGPNGAGKTTVMRMITGFMPPSSGRVTVAGYDIVTQSLEARRHIGYLPETVPIYPEMTVDDYLGFMGRIRGMSGEYVRRRINEVIDICRLEDYQRTFIGNLSKGFRQRLGIAQAILHEPDILILDEPTIGIDPIQVVETRQLIKSLGQEHTLIVSTHILPEVSTICERVIIIHEGEIVAVDTPEKLGSGIRGGQRVELDVNGPSRSVAQALRAVEGVQNVARTPPTGEGYSSYVVESRLESEVRAQLASAVVAGGWELLRLEPISMSLEEIFLHLTTSEEVPEA